MRFTPLGKVIVGLLLLGVLIGGWRLLGGPGSNLMGKIAPEAKEKGSIVPARADLPEANESTQSNGSTGQFTAPSKTPGCTDKPEVRMLVWAWNAQMGAMLANGGPQATSGSLMCKHGVNLKFIRQDDSSKMAEALMAFAQELHNGSSNPAAGAHYVCIMGDGSATFLKGLNDNLKRLGPEYTAKIVGSCGYSRGEDKFMGPQAWKDNPASSKGGVVAGVIRDGDWNIAQKWLGDNGLRNNPNEKTWDPDALNWVGTSDYVDAATKYVTGYSEDRAVVRNGKKTGETKHITVQGTVTWTPGDVTVAQKKGGIVSIASTLEYRSQMPHVIIGIDKWMKDHRSTVEGMLQAFCEGADLVKTNADALKYAAGVSAQVYAEQDAAYWERYYRGSEEKDKTGVPVYLGGSSVNNLADNLMTFGKVPGSANLFAATYTVFGDIVKAQYPELVPTYYPADQVVDTSYLDDLAKKASPTETKTAVAKTAPKFNSGEKVQAVVSRKAWNIQFESGRAAFTPAAERDLQKLKRDLLVASGTVVEVHGHTDNVGNSDANMKLSEQRAFAVKSWLEKQSPVNFPEGRVRVFAQGATNPLVPNDTPEHRAKNRRVEIVLGTTATSGG